MPQPVGCFTEPVWLARPLEDYGFDRTYIRATGDVPNTPGTAVFEAIAERARTSAAWRLHRDRHEPHDPEQPPEQELADLLLELT